MSTARNLEMDIGRDNVRLSDISNRLNHRKEFKTTVTRTRNKITNAIEMAKDLITTGRLLPETEYEVVRDRNRLVQYVQKCLDNDEYVCDLETTGLDVFLDIIVGICLYTPNEVPIYIPINHTDINNVRVPDQLGEGEVKEILRKLIISQAKAINHNIKFDSEMLITNWGYGFGNIYFDTAIGGRLLNENEMNHKLKYLYAKYIKKTREYASFDDLFDGIPFNYVPIDVAGVYGGNDPYITYRLYQFQANYLRLDHPRSDFQKLAKVLFEIEMPLVPVLINMELRGVELDEEFADELKEKYSNKIIEVKDQLDSYVARYRDQLLRDELINRLTKGTGMVNYNSPDQLKILLYKVFKLPVVDRRKPQGTGKDIIAKWLFHDKISRELKEWVKLFQEYKTLRKLLSDYIIKLPKARAERTNAVHTSFNQVGTDTGRFSSSHPIYKINLQNIPSKNKEIRKIFKAREGYVFIGSDFSQIEPRTLASLSGDEEMMEAYRQGKDLYATMGARVYGVGYWDCMEKYEDGTPNPEGKIRRDSMKSVLLGIMYCRGAKAIAEQFDKSVRWAEKLIEEFNSAYPKIARFSMKVVHFAETYGYVTTHLGRKRRLPDIKISDKEDWKYQEAYRQCVNSVIQGTAADIVKLAMVAIGNDEEFKGLGGHLVLTIHDEIIAEAPEENALRCGEILVYHMRKVGEDLLNLPMKCDVEITRRWFGQDVEDELVDLYGDDEEE